MAVKQPLSTPAGSEPAAPSRRQPLHAVILGALRDAIRSGEWRVGDSLPSEQDIGERYGASRITVRHALQRLETEGFVRKRHGRRTEVVASEPAPQAVWRIDTIEDLIASAGSAELRILSYRPEHSEAAAEALDIDPQAKLWCLRSLLQRDGRPYARSLVYLPPEIGSLLSLQDFDDVIVFRVLERRLAITVADVTMTVQAGKSEPEDVRLLGCARGDPMLTTQLVYRSSPGTVPVEVAFTRFPAGTYSLRYSVTAGRRNA
jgi:DNA-binding GntR family transcriptional regulator